MAQIDRTIKAAASGALRLAVTGAVIAASAGMVAGGRAVLAARQAQAAQPAAAAPLAAPVLRFAMQDAHAVTRTFTGQIEPAQRTVVAFEIGGTLAAVLVGEGETVPLGTPLARLDTRLLEAERQRLRAARAAVAAQAELAARTTGRQSALQARGVASSQALDAAALGAEESAARLAEIDADLLAVDIRLDKATLTAPYAARVAARHLDLGASAEPGRPVVTLVETAGPQFRVGLPPDAVAAIPPDGRVAVHVEGRVQAGRLRAVLPELDPATRTRTVLFDLAADDLPAWRSTGTLTLTGEVATRGGWVPLSALEAGPRGLWRLMTVSERDGETVVGAEAVEILYATAERAFVRGTIADGAWFIADGPHRVVPGQMVRAVEAGR